MKFNALQQKTNNVYPALLLETLLSHKARRRISSLLLMGISFIFVIMIAAPILGGIIDSVMLSWLLGHLYPIRGLFFVVFSIWLAVYLLDAMYYSFYFHENSAMDFEVARIVFATKPHDVTGQFLKSDIGLFTMLRLGIPAQSVTQFLKTRKHLVTTDEYEVIEQDDDPYVSLAEYARSLMHFDPEFVQFLKQYAIDGDLFKGALTWVAESQHAVREYEAWWHKDRLARIPSIGREWSFGQVYYLEQYGHALSDEAIYQTIGAKTRVYTDTVETVERILVKDTGANVMIISNETASAMELVATFGKEVADGTVRPQLERKRIFVLTAQKIMEAMQEKTEIEATFRRIFEQAAGAGDVVIVIPDLPNVALSAVALNVDVLDVIGQALASLSVQVIAVSSAHGFHESIETHRDFMRHFEKIILPEFETDAVLTMVQGEAHALEAQSDIFFTFPALVAVVESAERYFSDGSLSDKAIDILHEVVPLVRDQKRMMVTRDDVMNLVQKRTGIPQGHIAKEEQDTLQHLEAILHKRIVGQEAAVTAVSQALRRARAGLTDPKRPMGSFLFLGPTGVGKTETTKALAQTFFGSEEKIIRVDMSEYSGVEGLTKLIGSFESKQPGLLSSKLREQQYGVLLLDEFEKASQAVHDLFLQILDEGYFTDGRGERVNARNLIIIATSNAGSDVLYEAAKTGRDVATDSSEIVNEIIARGTYRPELLNRFDGVIVFHVLNDAALTKVAGLLIDALNTRLTTKGIHVEKTESLLKYLVRIGKNPQFGARAMKRAVQDEVEGVVADGLISGAITSGATVELVEQRGVLMVK